MKKVLYISKFNNNAIGRIDKEFKLYNQNNSEIYFLKIFPYHNNKFIYLYKIFITFISILYHSFFYKIIHFSSPDTYANFIQPVLFFKKIIITVHHLEKYWPFSWMGKMIMRTANVIMPVSNFTKIQLINDLNVNEKKIIINNIGINPDYYQDLKKNYKHFPYFLYIGDEYPRKNLKNILSGFKLVSEKYPELKLLKIGKTSDPNDAINTDRFIQELGLKDKVILKRNFFTVSELREHYSNALCLLLISKVEGFGRPIAEAMACGCPVITANRPPMTEIASPSQLKADPENIYDIAEKMNLIISNTNLQKKIIKEGLNFSKQFSLENFAKRTYEIYEKVINTNG